MYAVDAAHQPSPIIVPEPDRSPRRRRRIDVARALEPASSESQTMAPDGGLGLAPAPESSRSTRRRSAGPSAIGDGAVSSTPSRAGRTDSAAS
jgi:hypothetical protein